MQMNYGVTVVRIALSTFPQVAGPGAYGAHLDMNALHDRRYGILVRIVLGSEWWVTMPKEIAPSRRCDLTL